MAADGILHMERAQFIIFDPQELIERELV